MTRAAKKNENPLFPLFTKWLTCLKEILILVFLSASNNNPFWQVISSAPILPIIRTSSSLSLIIVCSIIILSLSIFLSIWHWIWLSPASLLAISHTNDELSGYTTGILNFISVLIALDSFPVINNLPLLLQLSSLISSELNKAGILSSFWFSGKE